MRVLSSVSDSGKTRYCDSRCHLAAKKTCNCICGGMLHGRGEAFAAGNAKAAAIYVNLSHKSIIGGSLGPSVAPL